MISKCRHGLDPRFCNVCAAPQNRVHGTSGVIETRRRRNATAKKRPASSPVILNWTFINAGRTLVVRAKIADGWRATKPTGELRKTYCFSEVARVDWLGSTVRAQLSLFPRPGSLDESLAGPFNLNFHRHESVGGGVYRTEEGKYESRQGVLDCFELKASGGEIEVRVDLRSDSGEPPTTFDPRPLSGGSEMFERIISEVRATTPKIRAWSSEHGEIEGWFYLDVQFRLMFKPPSIAVSTEYSDWHECLLGGRPESNRRKF